MSLHKCSGETLELGDEVYHLSLGVTGRVAQIMADGRIVIAIPCGDMLVAPIESVIRTPTVSDNLFVPLDEAGQSLLAIAIIAGFVALVVLALAMTSGHHGGLTGAWYDTLCQTGASWACGR